MTAPNKKDSQLPINLTIAEIAAIWGLCLIVKNKHPDLYSQDPLHARVEELMADRFITSNTDAF